jgi:hypothetical protein
MKILISGLTIAGLLVAQGLVEPAFAQGDGQGQGETKKKRGKGKK